MKRKDAIELFNKLQGVRYHSDNVKFSYALIKNIKEIENEISKLNEAIKPSEEFKQFEQDRIAVCQLHCLKDENGNPIVHNEEFQIADMDKFNQDLIPIKERYGDILRHRQQQIETYNAMLDEDIDFQFTKVGPDDLPSEITPNEIEDIYPILL